MPDLSALRRIGGFAGGWLVDSETGSVMASETAPSSIDHLETMGTAISMAKANLKALCHGHQEDRVDDILISLGRRMHLIRPLDGSSRLCMCIALDSESANPLLARMQLRRIVQGLRL